MEIQFANIPTVKVLSPTPIATTTSTPQFSLTSQKAYLAPLVAPLFIITAIIIATMIFHKKIKSMSINYESLKIVLLVSILTVLLIITWQTRYEYFDSHDVLRLDKLTGAVELRRLIEEIKQPRGVR